MNAVTTIEPQSQVANTAQAENSILAVIARAAADPSCDLDKMERLLNMQERVMAKQAEVEFNSAMAAMQAEIPSVAERGKSHSGAYATLEDIVDVVRPILHEYGFAVSFRVQQAERITVTGVLMHKGGHREETSLTLAADTSGSKNAVQAIGSSVSYGKRYVICAMLNIATRGADDNGYAAVPERAVNAQPKIPDNAFGNALAQVRAGKLTAQYLIEKYALNQSQRAALDATGVDHA